MKRRFAVVDYFEGYDTIETFDTIEDARDFLREYAQGCNYYCDCEIIDTDYKAV